MNVPAKLQYLKILMLEDLSTDVELARHEIQEAVLEFDLLVVETEEDYRQKLSVFKPDLIISDFLMPTFDGIQAIRIRNQLCPELPLVILTGSRNEDTAVDCLKTGADVYVIKEHIKRLGPAIIGAVNKKKKEQEILLYQEQLNLMTMELTLSVERQRKEIASNIHDYLSQTLLVKRMRLKKLLHNPDLKGHQGIITGIDDSIGEAIKYSRELTSDFSPSILYAFGLPEAVEWLVNKKSEETGILISFDSFGSE